MTASRRPRPRLLPLPAALAAALAPLAGCDARAPALPAAAWPEANALFTGDPRWIGGDGAYSVDLGGDRVLWLFGDSFIALGPERARTHSYMVRNSVALQTGRDPTRAFLRYYWREREAHPSSFVPEEDGTWLWPGHGIRLGDALLLFYGRLYQAREGMWGFEPTTWTALLVENPDDEPSAWRWRETQNAAEGAEVQLGGAVVEHEGWLYVYGIEGDRHDAVLARFDRAAAERGDLTAPRWWTGDGWGEADERSAIVAPGAPEFSVHWAEPLGRWVYTATEGFGPTTLAIRTAPAPEGPWTAPRDVLRPPESYERGAFVYAGKAHPELTGGDLVATYVPSSFDDLPPDTGDLLYYPRFVRLEYP